jgi:hypothetical protein
MIDLPHSPPRLGRRRSRWSLSAIPVRLGDGWRRLRIRTARVTPDQWFLALLMILLLAFFVAILFQPAAGRGGR